MLRLLLIISFFTLTSHASKPGKRVTINHLTDYFSGLVRQNDMTIFGHSHNSAVSYRVFIQTLDHIKDDVDTLAVELFELDNPIESKNIAALDKYLNEETPILEDSPEERQHMMEIFGELPDTAFNSHESVALFRKIREIKKSNPDFKMCHFNAAKPKRSDLRSVYMSLPRELRVWFQSLFPTREFIKPTPFDLRYLRMGHFLNNCLQGARKSLVFVGWGHVRDIYIDKIRKKALSLMHHTRVLSPELQTASVVSYLHGEPDSYIEDELNQREGRNGFYLHTKQDDNFSAYERLKWAGDFSEINAIIYGSPNMRTKKFFD